MEITPGDAEVLNQAVMMIRILAGMAALKTLVFLKGMVGGKGSKEWNKAQAVSRDVFGAGFEPSGMIGSNKGGPPSDD